MDQHKFLTAVEQLQRRGYEAGGYPDYSQSLDDRDICDRATCPYCRHCGMTYRPFLRAASGDYVAYAACPNCMHAEEF